jgi:protease-4
MNSFSNNIMDSIANQRNMSLAEIENDANNLNLNLSKNCLKLNYVDKLLYQDEVEDILKKISNSEQLKIVNIDKYTKKKMKGEKISRNKIAIIYATGTIKSGKGDEESIGSETLINAIRKARKDEKVKAIILRINSGGGSALASDVIWRETILAKKEKPFIISMGDYAASGGYYIACAADSIIANPTTLTGSIGVFGIIPNMQKFYNNK